MRVCLAPTHLLRNVRLGGHAWVFLNWALGLRDQGCELILLENLRWRESPEQLMQHLRGFRQRLATVGLGGAKIAPVLADELPRRLAPVRQEFEALTISLEQACAEADLFLNFNYGIRQDVVDRFRRSAMVDIDPGLLQTWMAGGHVRPAIHDMNFTIGETVGRPGARFSDCDMKWHHLPPPVHLPSWSVTRAPATAAYTTVTNWWGEYEIIDGEMINNEKRTTFLDYLDLPSRVSATLELAIYHEPGHDSDMPMLIEHGWRARPAYEVSSTPYLYRSYIQGSRGEFSCAKRSCMHLQNAWISDRTVCYLASGKPAVVQHTGTSSFLPDAEGLFRFRSMEEAVAGLAAAEADYEHHSRAARALGEEHFDADKVLGRLLETAMTAKPHKRGKPGRSRSSHAGS
ncbi:MAG: hypothetical protein ACYS5W_22620 [Planctomycetota bacterium]|jgi:hypothetical protein